MFAPKASAFLSQHAARHDQDLMLSKKEEEDCNIRSSAAASYFLLDPSELRLLTHLRICSQ